MKQYKINKAYSTLVRLAELKLPIKKSYALYKMAKAMEEAYEFAVNEEQKYIAEYKGVVNSDGTVTFENAEIFGEFQEKIDSLNEMEVDIEITPVTVTEDEMVDQTISPSEIFNLEGFVSFE